MVQVDNMTLSVPLEQLQDSDALLSREWLVTNGLGGYASGTLLGAPTRRYHGMFVPDLPSPWGRTVMIPRLDEEVVVEGESVLLSGIEFEDGRLESDLTKVISAFTREWQTPVWRCSFKGRQLEKRVIMPYGHNSVYVEYRLLEGDSVRLHLRPFVTFRMLDAPLHDARKPPFPLTVLDGRYEMSLCENAPSLKMCLRPHAGVFVADPLLSPGVSYRVDRDRGAEHVESLASPGYFSADLMPGLPIAFVSSTEPWEHLEFTPEAIFDAEAQRLNKLVAQLPDASQHDIERWLTLAADQFIVLPGSRMEEQALARASGDEARTVIAGYHWFTDWGRDTMIAMRGLIIATGKKEAAKSILRTFLQYLDGGMIPNRFPDLGEKPEYNTIDATLWLFVALNEYHEQLPDDEFIRSVFGKLTEIIKAHYAGTRYNIHVTPEGLLYGGQDGTQLTWMDAKVGDYVVTPRIGCPVEINALWFNALSVYVSFGNLLGFPVSGYVQKLKDLKSVFRSHFVNDKGYFCLLYTSPSPRDRTRSRMPSSA